MKDEILEKYGDVKLSFDFYYKYKFTFKGKAENGFKVVAVLGGGSNTIYKERVNAEDTLTLSDDRPWYSVSIYDESGKEVYRAVI